jgi:integrase
MADDTVQANGTHVLDYAQALEAAETFFNETVRLDRAGVHIGPYTVSDAARAWLATQTSSTSEIHVRNEILPELGSVQLKRLTKAQVYSWHQHLGKKPTMRSQMLNSKVPFDINDPETLRKRQDTANRVLHSLKAILNLARSNGHIDSDAAWATVDQFRGVAKERTEYLTVEEGMRFLEVCRSDFADLVKAALYTGCRYGELCKLPVSAFDDQTGCLRVWQTKSKSWKIIYLNLEESAFFKKKTVGKTLDAKMFLRADGTPWLKDHQKTLMRNARISAGIEQHITFHNLRHTFASLLMMNGTQPELVQQQMGHSSLRMTQRYMHFSESYAAKSVRANKPLYRPVGALDTQLPSAPPPFTFARKTGTLLSMDRARSAK